MPPFVATTGPVGLRFHGEVRRALKNHVPSEVTDAPVPVAVATTLAENGVGLPIARYQMESTAAEFGQLHGQRHGGRR